MKRASHMKTPSANEALLRSMKERFASCERKRVLHGGFAAASYRVAMLHLQIGWSCYLKRIILTSKPISISIRLAQAFV